MAKYIFVTGGVTSSLGKGILSASLAKLLQARGHVVTIQKFDPYINVDPGTLNPYEHGECYVTDDGAETDLDLGHYERFLNTPTSQANNVTTGLVYQTVINRERKGEFLGKTVQVVPHITDEIMRRMMLLGERDEYDIIITELGGTVGDIESLPYVEAVRQLRWKLGASNCLVVHLTLIPYLQAAKELKTKPTQHSVKELLEAGVQPDILVCRTSYSLPDEVRQKIASFCNVEGEAVIENIDVSTIYDVPLEMLREKLDIIVLKKLDLDTKQKPDMATWEAFVRKLKAPKEEVKIGLIGKYVELQDAYKSIHESFIQSGASNECKVVVETIHSAHITKENVDEKLGHLHGILVAPGFGERGIEGKITAINYVREKDIPFFGICLGMQCAAIEFARNVLSLKGSHTTEIDTEAAHPVIDLMEDQKKIVDKGGTMRLGSYPCSVRKKSKLHSIYNKTEIAERHRHRFEFNNKYRSVFEEAGMISTGINPDTDLVEAMELESHPWFIGVQFHPELKSTVDNPHPLFVSFVKAAMDHNRQERTASGSSKEESVPSLSQN